MIYQTDFGAASTRILSHPSRIGRGIKPGPAAPCINAKGLGIAKSYRALMACVPGLVMSHMTRGGAGDGSTDACTRIWLPGPTLHVV